MLVNACNYLLFLEVMQSKKRCMKCNQNNSINKIECTLLQIKVDYCHAMKHPWNLYIACTALVLYSKKRFLGLLKKKGYFKNC